MVSCEKTTMINSSKSPVREIGISDAQTERAKDALNGMSEEEVKVVLTTIPSQLLVMEVLERLESAEKELADIRNILFQKA